MNKPLVFQSLFAQLNDSLSHALEAAQQAHDLATHEQSKAETQYDTVAIEAGFLAQGQAQRADELKQAIDHWQTLALKQFNEDSEISEGALVELTDDKGAHQLYLLGKLAGGLKLNIDNALCYVISKDAPMGKQLLGKQVGDEISHPSQQQQWLEITQLC